MPIELSGGGPRSRHSPLGSGGVTPRPCCRRCKRIAEPKVRIRSPPAKSRANSGTDVEGRRVIPMRPMANFHSLQETDGSGWVSPRPALGQQRSGRVRSDAERCVGTRDNQRLSVLRLARANWVEMEPISRGTGSSNPSPSSGESANFQSLSVMTPSLAVRARCPARTEHAHIARRQHVDRHLEAPGNCIGLASVSLRRG
jgi:hypothetical protein